MYFKCILNFLVKALVAVLLTIITNQSYAEISIGIDN